MTKKSDYIKENIWEIRNSTSLKLFGIAISIAHIVNFINFKAILLKPSHRVLCWGFFQHCEHSFLNTLQNQGVLLNVYLFFSVISLIGFVFFQISGFAFYSLIFALIINFVIFIFDYSFSSNLNTLTLWLSLFFLFAPQKNRTLRGIIIASIIIGGLLKINKEWLAGYWLQTHLGPSIPIKVIELIASVVLFIEIVAPFTLLSRQAQKFYPGFILLLIYYMLEVFALGPVSVIPPILFMIYIIFHRFEDFRIERESLYRSYIRPEPSKLWAYGMIAVFCPLQLLPHYFIGTQHLHYPLGFEKPHVPVHCMHYLFLKNANGISHLTVDEEKLKNENPNCQKLKAIRSTKELCTQLQNYGNATELDSFFYKRDVGDKSFTAEFELKNVCRTFQSKE